MAFVFRSKTNTLKSNPSPGPGKSTLIKANTNTKKKANKFNMPSYHSINLLPERYGMKIHYQGQEHIRLKSIINLTIRR